MYEQSLPNAARQQLLKQDWIGHVCADICFVSAVPALREVVSHLLSRVNTDPEIEECWIFYHVLTTLIRLQYCLALYKAH